MPRQILGLRVASAVFGLISLAQLVRFIVAGSVTIGGRPLPLWPSALAFFIFGALSLWLWSISRET